MLVAELASSQSSASKWRLQNPSFYPLLQATTAVCALYMKWTLTVGVRAGLANFIAYPCLLSRSILVFKSLIEGNELCTLLPEVLAHRASMEDSQ